MTACFTCIFECICRHQGQPLLAACAALTVNDVAGAVSALHLGHEPEQAAMLCVALGQLGGVEAGLQDRVFAALGSKCEAAGKHQMQLNQACSTSLVCMG